jgi:hypothetical protein
MNVFRAFCEFRGFLESGNRLRVARRANTWVRLYDFVGWLWFHEKRAGEVDAGDLVLSCGELFAEDAH